ncbi:MAG: 16S rRNA (cytidine(1402)-2'-O)-methyltransferase, partial [Eubacterium sp.]|nr:16S rRNA (cytidine(1402)-2'-O)-methyltransferase [Eubacterium sp.]
EITKIHEEVIRTNLEDAIRKYTEEKPKGEFVLILEGKKKEAKEITLEEAVDMAKRLVENGLSVNAAAKEISSQTPFKKSDIYKELI